VPEGMLDLGPATLVAKGHRHSYDLGVLQRREKIKTIGSPNNSGAIAGARLEDRCKGEFRHDLRDYHGWAAGNSAGVELTVPLSI